MWSATLRRGKSYEKSHAPFPAYLKQNREFDRSLQNAPDFPRPGQGDGSILWLCSPLQLVRSDSWLVVSLPV